MNIVHKSDSRFILQQLSRLQMNVTSIWHCQLDSTWRSANAKAPFTRVYIPISGEGRLVCGGQSVELKPGYIYLIPADSDLSFQCDAQLEKVFAHIFIPRMDKRDLFQGQNRCAVLPDTENLRDIFAEKCQSLSTSDILLLKGYLYQIVARAMNALDMSATANTQYSPMVSAAIEFIDNHLSANLTAQEIAKGIFSSVYAMQKRFKQEVGITLGKYINHRLVTSAAYMLYSTKLSAKQISQELGFCDQFYFSRVFTAYYGVAPSEYRKRIGQ